MELEDDLQRMFEQALLVSQEQVREKDGPLPFCLAITQVGELVISRSERVVSGRAAEILCERLSRGISTKKFRGVALVVFRADVEKHAPGRYDGISISLDHEKGDAELLEIRYHRGDSGEFVFGEPESHELEQRFFPNVESRPNVREKLRETLDDIYISLGGAPEYVGLGTSLAMERAKIRGNLSTAMESSTSVTAKQWLRLAIAAADDAFNYFDSGDTASGCRVLQQAASYVASAIARKSIRTNFAVGPSGDVTPSG